MARDTRPSAQTTWSLGQRLLLLGLFALVGWLWVEDAQLLLWVCDVALLVAFALIVWVKLASILSGLIFHDMENPDLEGLVDDELPIYTILVPMYKEPTMVQPRVRIVWLSSLSNWDISFPFQV